MKRAPENFYLADGLDPITNQPVEDPIQLELKPRTEGVFDRNANRIIRQHKKGLKNADR